jgi:hypothetical protein
MDGGIITGANRRRGDGIIMQVTEGQCDDAEWHYNASKWEESQQHYNASNQGAALLCRCPREKVVSRRHYNAAK